MVKKEIGNRGAFSFVNADQTIMEVFEMTGFDKIFHVVRDEETAKDIKVIFFDIDGTLLSHTTGKVPQSTVEAIRKLQKKGKHNYSILQLSSNKTLQSQKLTQNTILG